ncbi:MAG: hypothetical protein HC877_16170 [Thioploca sp.]|nr:hypothetical protein [Thioploca sp.]
MKQPKSHEPTIPFNIGPAFLEPQAWDALTQASDLDSYISSWLVLLCASIVGTEKGVVILYQPAKNSYNPIAFWPTEAQAKTDGLMQASEIALAQKKGICRRQDDTYSQLAYPIRENNELSGVVTLEVRGLTPSSAPIAMRLLQWGLAGLLLALKNTDSPQGSSREAALQSVLENIALVLEHQGFYKATMLLVTQLATQLNCHRVALGWVTAHHYRLIALSHHVTFSEKTQLSLP